MKTRKTVTKHRGTYRYFYQDCNGHTEVVELRPGEQGVTKAWIKLLHAFDDSEVYNNCKNGRPKLSAEEKTEKTSWEAEHPGEKYPGDWNLSLDYLAGDNNSPDKSSIMRDNAVTMPEASYTTERVHEVMDLMTDKQKQVMQLNLDGYLLTEIAARMGTSIPNVKKHLDKAMAFLKNNY